MLLDVLAADDRQLLPLAGRSFRLECKWSRGKELSRRDAVSLGPCASAHRYDLHQLQAREPPQSSILTKWGRKCGGVGGALTGVEGGREVVERKGGLVQTIGSWWKLVGACRRSAAARETASWSSTEKDPRAVATPLCRARRGVRTSSISPGACFGATTASAEGSHELAGR